MDAQLSTDDVEFAPTPTVDMRSTHRAHRRAGIIEVGSPRFGLRGEASGDLHVWVSKVHSTPGPDLHFSTTFPALSSAWSSTMPLGALGGSVRVTPGAERLPDKFHRLADEWRRETGFLSSGAKRLNHPAYLKIVAMGRDVVPLLLDEMREGRGGWWHTALHLITEDNPVPESDAGNFPAICRAWAHWGEAHWGQAHWA